MAHLQTGMVLRGPGARELAFRNQRLMAPSATSAWRSVAGRPGVRYLAFKVPESDKTWGDLAGDAKLLAKGTATKLASTIGTISAKGTVGKLASTIGTIGGVVGGLLHRPTFEEEFPYDTPFTPIEGLQPPSGKTADMIRDVVGMSMGDILNTINRSVQGQGIALFEEHQAKGLSLIQADCHVQRILGYDVNMVYGSVNHYRHSANVNGGRRTKDGGGVQFRVCGSRACGYATVIWFDNSEPLLVTVQCDSGSTIKIFSSCMSTPSVQSECIPLF